MNKSMIYMENIQTDYNKIYKNAGQSLIEAVVAMAIFALLAASLASLILGSLDLSSAGGLITQADMLAQEGVEAVKTIKNRAWSELVYSKSAVTSAEDEWRFVGEGSDEQLGKFSRQILFFPVYRDSTGNICASNVPDAFLDTESRELRVRVQWQSARETDNFVEKSLLLTNWSEVEPALP
ncbi:MAG: hypothetical protein US83_C0013G0005 [Candidatus Falkowbacteria bacterium GW2011_GWC2_38_22]|uniref:Uncharacterized protein n=1 Tax=Candidatus Falkowbacteria bacterium GW2011_GWE1_38_31 TaxID=1618638 RepID=A0A0G0JQY5_9BACT|nr:MAG: hypothetical protein US73_C0006G0066 [Candidatus Falkowbacteria bacterium GW2011_GWF2_38_1205]KKQ60715.1 MAG: hypothetical protein US83_C0013G0005 [Candidatus Falkowbacteria bacterium GW2011_GWC2_38_22]KKQ63266.1 MAG: hypothetical protein US84_C0007G0008 [Candidatus Falkowbacteria bacterium GW2011_GWF1_38_22]KKQ65616.1 MAG: hypothetical protein US87_C0006G0066 [Candidatus Falkowbacteria bacterium GW2011_GWE2_38_254]KKQ69998.1 MAG: hypothetical protein US91_C0007G0008 [Candidatus Falkowb